MGSCFNQGVLIHVNPSLLEEVYKKLHKATDKYILIAEYYNELQLRWNIEVSLKGSSSVIFVEKSWTNFLI